MALEYREIGGEYEPKKNTKETNKRENNVAK